MIKLFNPKNSKTYTLDERTTFEHVAFGPLNFLYVREYRFFLIHMFFVIISVGVSWPFSGLNFKKILISKKLQMGFIPMLQKDKDIIIKFGLDKILNEGSDFVTLGHNTYISGLQGEKKSLNVTRGDGVRKSA